MLQPERHFVEVILGSNSEVAHLVVKGLCCWNEVVVVKVMLTVVGTRLDACGMWGRFDRLDPRTLHMYTR